jgi:hypothetical protein
MRQEINQTLTDNRITNEWSVSPQDPKSPRQVTVTNTFLGGITANYSGDTTGENGASASGAFASTKRPSEHISPTWFWTFLILLNDGNGNAVVPNGVVMTMTIKAPRGPHLSVSVIGNGVLTAAELLQQAVTQFQADGVTFTMGIDPLSGISFAESQPFPGTTPERWVEQGTVQWNAAWLTYLGGAGNSVVPAQ